MAKILERINELRVLPEEQHLFCPRVGDDGSVYYDEDIAAYPPETDPVELNTRKLKLREAEDRKWTALKATEILAFDGEEAAPHKEWLIKRLNHLMQSCDVCVRVFHQSRAEWRTRLIDSYDEENIGDFLQVVDEQCLGRIHKGLDEANVILSNAEPRARSVRLLPSECTYGFFEALSCDALIRNEELLQRHFDAPFEMVQTKKRLKVQTYLPAMTRFLFSKNERRQKWATESWSTFKRNLLKSEFEWAVRDHFVNVMLKVQMSNLDLSLVPLFWNGARLIIGRMDRELITDSIRGLDGEFYRLMLDHLSLRSEGFLDLIASMKQLLEKSPVDFWDGMNAVTPSIATVVEQILNSPILNQILLAATEEDEQSMNNLNAAFSWIPPFLTSIKEANLGPAVRPFAHALFGRFQSDQYSRTARTHCFKEGLKVLDYAFRKMGEGKTIDKFVGQPTVNGMLDMLSTHIQLLVTSLKRFKSSKDHQVDLQLALSVIQHAFQLEAQSLIIERQLISAKQPSPTETPPSSPIWKTVLRAIDSDSLELATHLLIAGRGLIGLELLQMKSGVDKVPATVRHFNDRFKLLSQSITDVVDRLSEFDPSQLQALFGKPAAASAIVSLLFSSTEDTRNSAIELLKVISLEDERRNALQHILRVHYKNVILGISDSVRQVRHKKAFAPAPSMIRTCSDIIDVMCNSQDGILRARNFDSGDAGATMNLWKNLWDSLTMIFATTEAWSNLGFYNKHMMMDFCRDTMQFADMLFDQCSIFATALKGSSTDEEEGTSKTELLQELLALPANAMEGLAKWLRLRDEFLSSKSVTLISKLLVRLHRVSIEIDPDTLSYMERVLSGDVRAKLSTTQQAELQQALETHLGRSLVKEEEPVKPKQASIEKWMSTGATSSPADAKSKLLASLTSGSAAFQERRDQMRASESKATKQKAIDDQKNAQQAEFRRKRQLELQKREKEKAAAIAKAKAARGVSMQIAEAGSGLEGLGVLGKDQAAKGEGLMHSSDESDDDDGDIDEDLFGIKKAKVKVGSKTNIVNEIKVQMPIKKKRVQRSVKDMRARLAPDLSSLHRTILGWDYFHEGDFPPKSRPDIYSKVPSTFRTPNDYQSTFEPLLTLEAWQGFVKAREDNQAKPYEVRITSRASVDAFQEVGSTMTHVENKEVTISEGDIILLSQSKSPSANEPTCLARVFRVKRKQQHIEVSYRVVPGNPLSSALQPNNTLLGTKLQSITPLEREYGALKGLQYYDLCDEIIRAKPSPLLTYKDTQIQPLISTYNVNKAQAKAIKSAIDNDAFTLIQGPPGSGKTKTITAIVGAILTDSFRDRGTTIVVPGQQRSNAVSKKLLVCAPSNAAVDELVMRFKDGIKTMNGEERKVNIVRLGRSDAMKANIQDVTLGELVNKRLGVNPESGRDAEATRKLFQDHKQISDQLRQAYEQRDSAELKGEAASKLADDINALRRQKTALGTQIDNAKDDEKLASRNADLNRRRAQEAVLNDAHIICATLSGSGHEMFQGLSIEFETVIVDEAAQCVEMSALIPLKYGCAKCILVGDPKQLPPTVFSKEAARFQYEQSLFVRMQKNHPDDVHLLDTQYRMHPEISLFPSQTFYDGRLLDGGDMAGLRKRPWHQSSLLGPYRFFDVQGQHQAEPKGHSLINIAEIKIAMQLYKRLTSDYPDYDFKGKVGIITPYKSQLRELKSRFTNAYGASIIENIDFNTTDAFQGRESEVIIFSCVRASPSGGVGFLQDIRRMNVGLTRAKSSLWVLGNSRSLVRGEFWKKLIVDAKDRKRYTEGDVHKMLSQHSRKFPALKEAYVQPPRPMPEVKSEPMNWSGSIQSNGSSGVDQKPSKQEVKQEIKIEQTLVHHGKRKFEHDSNGIEDVKVKVERGDVEMEEAPSDSASNTLNGGSDRSTPAAFRDGPRKSATPSIEANNGTDSTESSAAPGNAMGGMTKPKIRRRPREPPNPFIKQKKPKTG
ncbi:tRNA-splicing endonuclease-like protein [Cucurbitaria berberidis CBS 394.84]|uniref:tRNA-splicing endonuclease-like protein n=1 Tax=Cucurbitaria berberidis CBS 394.84 TaxID=1168544 RepID=A0A9P4GUM5_9PLEO|nr:tRNA-splicing endonuclease-like protein [Cucurbitaria berberidis CBS 394.84]KAF1851851.1 tRNA-splicing endonuclease-like protein [Cucurbitaria berberidis CBS 394.84]